MSDMPSHLHLALLLIAAIFAATVCTAEESEDSGEALSGAAAKRFDVEIAKKHHYFEDGFDVQKKFDPYSKRFDPYTKRFMTDRRRRFDLDLGRMPGLDSRAFFVQLGR